MVEAPENIAWKEACDEIGISYRQRRVSGAIISLCVFHDEKTPSMWMYPNGNLYCYGCGLSMTIADFTPKVLAGMARKAEFEKHVEELRKQYGPIWDEPPF